MYPHRIRLRGPWQIEVLSPMTHVEHGDVVSFRKYDLPPPRSVNNPRFWKDCGLLDFAGIVRYHRHFGLPRKLDEHETVWITCAGVADGCIVWLNGQRLANIVLPRALFEVEATGRLQGHNELWLDIHSDHPNGGLCGEVALEIRALAWLHDLQVTLPISGEAGLIQLDGAVIGHSDSPLDLYAILDRKTILQQTVLPKAIGGKFHFQSDQVPLDDQVHSLRVELVCGSNVWYTADQTILLKKNRAMEQ